MFRQIATILLLCLFVFNIVGYRILVNISLATADTQLQVALDNNTYHQADLFLVKIPINLPYQTNWKGYERVDGEVTVAGETYKYVQRKVENDTMYLQCIRHTEKNNIQQKANDYFGKSTDVANTNTSKKSSTNTVKYSVDDFVYNHTEWQALIIININSFITQPNATLGSSHLQQLIRPPQA